MTERTAKYIPDKYVYVPYTGATGDVNLGTHDLSAGTVYATDTGSSVFNEDIVIETMTIGGGSITDSTGAISFGNENLSTTGTLGAGAITAGSLFMNGDISLGEHYIYDGTATNYINVNNGSDVLQLYSASTLSLDANTSVTSIAPFIVNETSPTACTIRADAGNGFIFDTTNGKIKSDWGTFDFDDDSITTTGTLSALSGTFSSLTSGRIVLVGTGGLLEDSANLTYTNSNLNVGADNLFFNTNGTSIGNSNVLMFGNGLALSDINKVFGAYSLVHGGGTSIGDYSASLVGSVSSGFNSLALVGGVSGLPLYEGASLSNYNTITISGDYTAYFKENTNVRAIIYDDDNSVYTDDFVDSYLTADSTFSGGNTILVLADNFVTETVNGLSKSVKFGTYDYGKYSLALLYGQSFGNNSFASGEGVVAQGNYQTAIGKWNIKQGTFDDLVDTDNAFIIGNGIDDDNRSNAFSVAWNGDVTIAGGLTFPSTSNITGGGIGTTLTIDNVDGTINIAADYLTIDGSAGGGTTILGYLESPQFTSTIATIDGAPFPCLSTALNTNLNADLWDGYQFNDYLNQAVKTTSTPTFTSVTATNLYSNFLTANDNTKDYISISGYNNEETPQLETLRLTFRNWGVNVSSTTGGSLVEWDLGFKHADNKTYTLGTGNDARIYWDAVRTNNSLFIETAVSGSTVRSGAIVIGEYGTNTNYTTPPTFYANPQLHIHSGGTNQNYRLRLWHDDTDGNFVSDLGNINILPKTGIIDFEPGTANTDLVLNFNGTTTSGELKWMEDEDYFEFSDDIMMLGGENIVLDTTTGTKIGTATSQLLGFYNATPVNQPDTVADPSGGGTQDAEARTAINALIDRLQELGLIA